MLQEDKLPLRVPPMRMVSGGTTPKKVIVYPKEMMDMDHVTRKPPLTSSEPLIDAGNGGQGERRPPEPKVWGSNLYGRAKSGGRPPQGA